MATTQAAAAVNAVEIKNPVFIQKLLDDYKSKVAHVFILYGNINDFSDNSGKRHGVISTLAQAFDDNIRAEMGRVTDRKAMITSPTENRSMIRIFATYNISGGLEFLQEQSKQQFLDALKAHYGADVWENQREDWKLLKPGSLESMFG